MNSMKTLVFALGLLGVASISIAQVPGPAGGVKAAKTGGQHGGGGGGFRMMGAKMIEVEDKVLTKIGATAAQKKQIVALRAKEKPAREKLMKEREAARAGGAKPAPPTDAQKTAMKSMQEAHAAAMTKILGDAKFAEYKAAMMEEFKAMGGGRGPGGPGGPGAGKKGKGGKTTPPPPQN